MREPIIAAALNFVVPGAGLLYLGRRWPAAANFAVAVLIVVGLLLAAPQFFHESMHYVVLAIAAGSAGCAHAVATQSR